ncbi:MAG: aminoacyl-tRNA hydrolase [Anaerovoracaceae bacterium]
MYVIVGLGNPGKKYEQTRHNMGFLTIDCIAEARNINVNKLKHKALIGEGMVDGHKVMLVKPQTFMNLSGDAVSELVSYYKIAPEELIIIYDDLDIEVGTIRVRKKGSGGTHNGMRSVISRIGFSDFPRVRIGIGGKMKMDIKDFVTGGFGKEEKASLDKAIEQSAKAAIAIITEGIDAAMNKYNGNC